MILETKILFSDELADSFGKKPEYVWGEFCIDLCEIIAVGEFIDQNEVIHGTSEITIRGGASRVVKTDYQNLKSLWKKANPEIKFAIN